MNITAILMLISLTGVIVAFCYEVEDFECEEVEQLEEDILSS